MLGLLVLNSPGDFRCRPMSYWSHGRSVCKATYAGSIGRTESMMRMQQCIIGCLITANHVFTMTRAPQGDQVRDWGEKGRYIE